MKENCIDVSTVQGKIDWCAVYNSGVRYAMIKATQGHGVGASTRNLFCFTDSKFQRNITEAARFGIKCGVYHYMTARTFFEADQEANHFLSEIAPYKDKLSLWVALDVEDATYLDSLSSEALTEVTKHFLNRISAAGYNAMLYTNPNYLIYRFQKDAFAGYPIWLAHYGVSKPYSVKTMKIWQYGCGIVPGVPSTCDQNILYEEPVHEQSAPEPVYQPGDLYTVKAEDVYTTGASVPKRIVGNTYTIQRVLDGKILLREIASWVKV